MKLVLFNGGRPGLLRDDGVVDISDAVGSVTTATGQAAMQAIIAGFESVRAELGNLEKSGTAVALSGVKLEAPLPRPDKILNMGGNFTEFGNRQPGPMWGFLKDSDAVIGPDDTVVLPSVDANIFHHEPELVLVFGRAGKDVKAADAMDYIFGYTCGIDVSARMPVAPDAPRPEFEAWRGISKPKSHPTFAPLGPAIVTKDEMPDPQNVHVTLSVDGELRGDYNTNDMAHSIEESIAFISEHESFSPGDVMYAGTNHQGLGAMQDGDSIHIEIEHVGGFTFKVSDPLKRRWDKGVDQETAQDVREGTGGPGRRKRPL